VATALSPQPGRIGTGPPLIELAGVHKVCKTGKLEIGLRSVGLGNLATTLIGTVILAVLVLLAPLRRAVRFKPGQALRHA
jgi:ABC-type lipoprotein release transport system permease subunit